MASDERDPLAQELVDVLIKKKMKITTAESCTGGLIAVELTAVSGTSAVFDCGIVSYSNEMKMKLLGVKEETLKAHGAVSEQVAMEMANGAKRRMKADIAISVTGIAGPTGGTAKKPVGLVYIAISTNKKTEVSRLQFTGNRKKIRESAMRKALALALEAIENS